jgi:hypothetical protein
VDESAESIAPVDAIRRVGAIDVEVSPLGAEGEDVLAPGLTRALIEVAAAFNRRR